MQDLPFYSLKHRDYTLEGYSRGAVQTYWRLPEMRLGFDLGAQPWAFMGTPNWFVSHSHMDHLGAIPQYVTRRRMMRMEPPTIYLPADAVIPVKQLLFQWQRLDHGRLPCNLVPIEPEQEIPLSRELIVKTFKANHTMPAMSFIVYQKRVKLKTEYLELPGEKIRDLREAGEEITYEIRTPLVAYTGDTRPEILDLTPDFYHAQLLIMEMTFISLEHSQRVIHQFGHTDLQDFVDRASLFENEVIVASHFSSRYTEPQIQAQVRRKLPDMLNGRLRLFL